MEHALQWSMKNIQCGVIGDIGSAFSNGELKASWLIRFQKEAEFTCVETLQAMYAFMPSPGTRGEISWKKKPTMLKVLISNPQQRRYRQGQGQDFQLMHLQQLRGLRVGGGALPTHSRSSSQSSSPFFFPLTYFLWVGHRDVDIKVIFLFLLFQLQE